MHDIRRLVPVSPQFPQKPKTQDKQETGNTRVIDEHYPPQERGFQSLPHPDVLMSMIDKAREAMRQGVFWDRGSILNLSV